MYCCCDDAVGGDIGGPSPQYMPPPGRQWLWWVPEIGWYPFQPGSRPMDGDGWREVSTSKVEIDDKVAKDSRMRQRVRIRRCDDGRVVPALA
jgi:hypothetical protein